MLSLNPGRPEYVNNTGCTLKFCVRHTPAVENQHAGFVNLRIVKTGPIVWHWSALVTFLVSVVQFQYSLHIWKFFRKSDIWTFFNTSRPTVFMWYIIFSEIITTELAFRLTTKCSISCTFEPAPCACKLSAVEWYAVTNTSSNVTCTGPYRDQWLNSK
jgi:hypothetical protein